jgi:hypothetical protein
VGELVDKFVQVSEEVSNLYKELTGVLEKKE